MTSSVLPNPPSYVASAGQDSVLDHEPEEEFLGKLPLKIGDATLPSYDCGVFNNELVDLKLYSKIDPNDPTSTVDAGGNITEGTYAGTQVALTQVYSQIEQRWVFLFALRFHLRGNTPGQ